MLRGGYGDDYDDELMRNGFCWSVRKMIEKLGRKCWQKKMTKLVEEATEVVVVWEGEGEYEKGFD